MAPPLVRETARDVLVLLWREFPVGPASATGHIRSPMLQQSADPSGTGKACPDQAFVARSSSPKSHIKPESDV